MSQFNTNEKEPVNVEYVEKPKKENPEIPDPLL